MPWSGPHSLSGGHRLPALLQGLYAPLIALTLALSGAAVQAQDMPVKGLIVKLRPGAIAGRESTLAAHERVAALARDSGLALQTERVIGGQHHLLRLSQPLQGQALDAMLRRLRLHPEVAAVEADVRVQRLAVPNDPGFVQQWHLQLPSVRSAAINMPPAWDRSTGNNAVVAVLDTGVRTQHPDLQGRLLAGYDFVSEVDFANDGDGRDPDPSDPGDWVTAGESRGGLFGGCTVENSSWHGTFIAGQIGALTNNGVGVAGVSWGARVLPVRVSGKCGALLSDILDGMRWAAGLSVAGVPPNATPARIINLSFGGDAACSVSYQDVIDEITAAGSLLVVAGGNGGAVPTRPADCRGVLSVAAVRADGAKTSYSNLGPTISLAAPGGASHTDLPIYSLDNAGVFGPTTDIYGFKEGTSFAAPLAAGVASLMLSINPALTPAQLVARMRAGTRAHTVDPQLQACSLPAAAVCNCTASTCGTGLLDAVGALGQAQNPAAVIAAISAAAPGTTLVLDGRGSAAALGSALASYQWSQTAGPALAIQSATAALATVTLPALAGSFSFKLRVQDTTGLAGEEQVSVSTLTAPPPASGGSGGGASGWAWGLGLWLFAAWTVWLRRRRRAQAGGQRS